MICLFRNFCACLLVGSLPTLLLAQDQTPEQLATTKLFTHEIEILSDGTWQFIDPDISIADVDVTAPICDQLKGGRVTFCHPDGEWHRSTVLLTNGVEEYVYRHPSGLTMSIARDVYYGHEGDLEFWEDLSKPGVGDWLVNKTINAVFGADFEQERTFVIDGVVYSESTYNDVDFSIGLFAELLVENDSIWIDITAFNFNADRDWGAQTQAFNQASSDIYNRIKIDGQSLSDLIIEQEAK